MASLKKGRKPSKKSLKRSRKPVVKTSAAGCRPLTSAEISAGLGVVIHGINTLPGNTKGVQLRVKAKGPNPKGFSIDMSPWCQKNDMMVTWRVFRGATQIHPQPKVGTSGSYGYWKIDTTMEDIVADCEVLQLSTGFVVSAPTKVWVMR